MLRLLSELNLIACAKPAASSSGDVILEPEDNRATESDNALADSLRVRLATVADIFELITMGYIKSPKAGNTLSKSALELFSSVKNT